MTILPIMMDLKCGKEQLLLQCVDSIGVNPNIMVKQPLLRRFAEGVVRDPLTSVVTDCERAPLMILYTRIFTDS